MVDFSGHMSSMTRSEQTYGGLKREADIRRALQQVTTAYGFRGFLVMMVPPKDCRNLSETVVMTDYPQDLLTGYDAACLLTGSPVIERLRRSTIPFTYDTTADAARRTDGKGNAVDGLFARMNLRRGVYIPVHDVHGTCGAVAFGGERNPVSSGELKELTFLAGGLFSRLRDVLEAKARPASGLSRREIECLNWAAAGKTTTEMAEILDLSEYTVNHYLSRATRKLDSVNRVQTVAKAIRAGLIN